MIDDAQVRHIAWLARLELTEEELQALKADLARILEHFRALKALDTTGVEPLAQAVASGHVLREDVPRPGLTRERALVNAPETDGEHFVVPAVFEER